MSYSYSIPHGGDELFARVDPLIDALPDGPGKEEAKAHRSAVLDALPTLAAAIEATAWTAYVSGHGSSNATSLNLSVSKAGKTAT